MFYRVFRSIASLALRLFFELEPPVDPHRALETEGPVVFVGNHPNGLIDPGILFISTRRELTFLAKEPLFRTPLIGWILRGLRALPVYRKQDGPGDTSKNEGTLAASVSALVAGGAITLFPEGKSHSEPQLAELKTGAARIALDAVRQGAPVRFVPVGITYAAKNRFRSRVHVEAGAPLDASAFRNAGVAEPHEAARALTAALAEALRAVTLNVEQWEDLPLVETAEALYALQHGDSAGNTTRQKAFARGLRLVRDENPGEFEVLKLRLLSFRQRLAMLRVTPGELGTHYRPLTVAWFVLRNLLWLASLPVVLLGLGLFVFPYYLPLLAVRATKPEVDVESTIKFVVTLVLAPLWWLGLVVAAGLTGGWRFALATLVGVPVVAVFTRVFLERRLAALQDVRTFFVSTSKRQLREALLKEGDALGRDIDGLVARYSAR